MQRADFVVVGGGIAGASAAYELAAHGRVVLLEQEATTGYHTTGRSAATFTEAYESGPVRKLAMASRGFLEQPPAGFADHPLLSPLPILFVGRDDQSAAVASRFEELQQSGPAISLIDRTEVLAACPVMDRDYVAAGILERGSKEIDVHGLHQGYLRGVRHRGGEVIVNARVERIEPNHDSWTVTSVSATVHATAVVNAAGAWCDTVAALAGARPIGLVPMRRTAFTFSAPEGVDSSGMPFVVDIDESWYFKPEGVGFLGSPADETPMEPQDVRHTEQDVAQAIERIEKATTMRIRHVRSAWAGLRSFVADRKPVVGEDPARPGFFWLAGQGGFGIMTSPALARALADLVVGGELPDDLLAAGLTAAELGPERAQG